MSVLSTSLPALIVMTSLLCGVVIFCLPEARARLRTTINQAGATIKLVLVLVMLARVADGVDGALGGVAQAMFQFGEEIFDWIEVR